MSEFRVIDLLGEKAVVDMLAKAACERSEFPITDDEAKAKARDTMRAWSKRGRVSNLWSVRLWELCDEKGMKVAPSDFRAPDRERVPA